MTESNTISEFKSLFEEPTKVKLFEISFGHNYRKEFTTIELIPGITLVVDNQSNETYSWTNSKGEQVIDPSYISISLIFDWLGLYTEIYLNIKTNKPVKYED